MPSTALQSRISAFESLGARSGSPPPASASNKPQIATNILDIPLSPSSTSRLSTPASPSPSPPNLGRKTSLIDLKDWIIDDGTSLPPTHGVKPYTANGTNNSNRHLDYNRTPTGRKFDTKRPSTAPLINLESPPRPKPSLTANGKAPPLPPRKPSFTSLKSAASSSPLISHKDPASLYPPHRSDSLTVEHLHTYPPLKVDVDSRFRNTPGHVPTSSISSFHSVSLSSDTDPSTPGSVSNFIATFPMDHERDRDFSGKSNSSEADSISLDESYEDVSSTSLASPATERMITLDWEKAMAKRKAVPPRLPQRPPSASSSSVPLEAPHDTPSPRSLQQISSPAPTLPRMQSSHSYPSSTSANVATTRRAPPPPPASRSSDRSSIRSTATSHSVSSTSNHSHSSHLAGLRTPDDQNIKTKRPTPVPPAARRRYTFVFNANVLQRRRAEKQSMDGKPTLLSPSGARRTRQAAGWRGLSVDLITGIHDAPIPTSSSDDDEEMEASGVVASQERLEGTVVRFIWGRSGLDRERLSGIWNECDSSNTGALDQDAFIKGMWRIDEELRRAQAHAPKSAKMANLGSVQGNSGYKPLVNKSKPILR